jgi:hypothetical protein
MSLKTTQQRRREKNAAAQHGAARGTTNPNKGGAKMKGSDSKKQQATKTIEEVAREMMIDGSSKAVPTTAKPAVPSKMEPKTDETPNHSGDVVPEQDEARAEGFTEEQAENTASANAESVVPSMPEPRQDDETSAAVAPSGHCVLENHELAEMFPMMSDKELENLADDIERNVQTEPIVLLKVKILDGRNRYEACTMLGIEP